MPKPFCKAKGLKWFIRNMEDTKGRKSLYNSSVFEYVLNLHSPHNKITVAHPILPLCPSFFFAGRGGVLEWQQETRESSCAGEMGPSVCVSPPLQPAASQDLLKMKLTVWGAKSYEYLWDQDVVPYPLIFAINF